MKQTENYIKRIGYKDVWIGNGCMKKVIEFIYDLDVYKKAFEDFYELFITANYTDDLVKRTVLKGTIMINFPLRKLEFYMWEDGTFHVKKPNGKTAVYNDKSPKQLIAIMNSIIRNAK